jgi:hypothetical protein
MGRMTDCLQLFGQNKKTLTGQGMRLVVEDSERGAELLACFRHSDKTIQKLAADFVKKIGLEYPQWAQHYKIQLLEVFFDTTVPQVQWHLCHLFPSLEIEPEEFEKLRPKLLDLYANSPRRAIKADALMAIVELSMRLDVHITESRDLLREALNSKFRQYRQGLAF